MRLYKDGAILHATVAGFLPDRKVLLEVDGETLIAYSNLPLVRGRVIMAKVESAGDGFRLRVIDSTDSSAADRPENGGGTEVDRLDRMITECAHRCGLKVTPGLFNEIRTQIGMVNEGLRTGTVPLAELQRDIFRLTAAVAHGLVPTPRALTAVDTDPDARLGMALHRLVENLDLAAFGFKGSVGESLAVRANRVRSFSIDLDSPELLDEISAAILSCGYAYEEKLAIRGDICWDPEEADDDSDLKGTLLYLWKALSELKERGVRRGGSDDAERGLEWSLAWTGRALDIIEGIQTRNLSGREGANGTLEYQLPVSWRGEYGTLYLGFSESGSRFRIAMGESTALGGDILSDHDSTRVVLYPGEPHGGDVPFDDPKWIDSVAIAVGSLAGRCRVTVEREPVRVTLERGDSPAPESLDIKL